MGAFYLVTFKHRQQTLSQHVLCPACRLADPTKLYEPTSVDDPSPYKTIVQPIYDRPCDECRAKPDALPKCACGKDAGPLAHPYYADLCRSCGDERAMTEGAAAFARKGTAA